jgi:polygalacturonase
MLKEHVMNFKKIIGLFLIVFIFSSIARLVAEELNLVMPELKSCLGSEPVGDINTAMEKVFDVRQFGAQGDGKTFDTEVVQKLLDDCGKAGGGTVRFSPGIYLCRPLFLRSSTTLQIDEGAILKASDNPKDFAPKDNNDPIAFINCKNLTNITISGRGIIDGSGAKWWDAVKEAKKNRQPEPPKRPNLIALNNCTAFRAKDITLTNSPGTHLAANDCEDMNIAGITILAPYDSLNTSAIGINACRYVKISDSVFDVDDDNISIVSKHLDSAHPDAASQYINITNCKILHGHGISIGSQTVGGIQNLTVSNCTFENTDNGIRIKSGRDRGGLCQNLTYSDITMKNVKIPISISAYYGKNPADNPSIPDYRNIRISNLLASSFENAGLFFGLPEKLISDVIMENVHITAPKGLTIRHAKVTLKNVKIETQESPPFILEHGAVVEGLEQIIK